MAKVVMRVAISGLALAGLSFSSDDPPIPAKLEGPPMAASAIRASGKGAMITMLRNSFQVRFEPQDRRALALFSFPPIDLSDNLGLAVDIRNTSRIPLRVYGELNEKMYVAGYVAVAPEKRQTLYILLKRSKFTPPGIDKIFAGMSGGIPGGQTRLWCCNQEIDAAGATSLGVFLVAPRTAAMIEVSNLRPFGIAKPPSPEQLAGEFFPFVDRFGQYKHKDWPGKIHNAEELKRSARAEEADLRTHPSPNDWDRYGGWAAGPNLEATGHFRVQKYQGRWWLVDPDGRLFWSHGIVGVGFGKIPLTLVNGSMVVDILPHPSFAFGAGLTAVEGRSHFFEDYPPSGDFLVRNLAAKYGDTWSDKTAEIIKQRLQSWGINTLAAWSDVDLAKRLKIPYMAVINSGIKTSRQPASDEWYASFRQTLLRVREKLNDDPYCIGIFVDNEIFIAQDAPSWWEMYYRRVNAAVKEILPKKLYMGSRLAFHDYPFSSPNRMEVVRLAGKYCDVISLNQYKYTQGDFSSPQDMDRPFIVGEFSFGALDRGMLGDSPRSVVDQKQRGDAYRHYVTSALKQPHIVGVGWFQFYDQPLTGRLGDGENRQVGFLDVCDQPYAETVAASRDVGHNLYRLRN